MVKLNFIQLEACRRIHPSLFARSIKGNTFHISQQLDWRLLKRIELAKNDPAAIREIFEWPGNWEPFERNPKFLELAVKAIGLKVEEQLFKRFRKILFECLLSKEAASLLSKKQCKKILTQVALRPIILELAIERKIFPQVDFYFAGDSFSIPSYVASHLEHLLLSIDETNLKGFGKTKVEQYIHFLKHGQAPFEQWYDLLKVACILDDTSSIKRLEKALSFQIDRLSRSQDLFSIIIELDSFNLKILKNGMDCFLASSLKAGISDSDLIKHCLFAKKYFLPTYLGALQRQLSETIDNLNAEKELISFLRRLNSSYSIMQVAEWEETFEPKLDGQLFRWLTLYPDQIDNLFLQADEEDAVWLKEKIRLLLREHSELLSFSAIPDDLLHVEIF